METFRTDVAAVEITNKDPSNAHAVQPTKTIQQQAWAYEWLKNEIPSIMLRLLILHGTRDKASQPARTF